MRSALTQRPVEETPSLRRLSIFNIFFLSTCRAALGSFPIISTPSGCFHCFLDRNFLRISSSTMKPKNLILIVKYVASLKDLLCLKSNKKEEVSFSSFFNFYITPRKLSQTEMGRFRKHPTFEASK